MATPEVQSASPPRKRRWYQFSLRTLMIVMLLASVGMSWFAVKLQQARRQREAVAAIEAAGGLILYYRENDRDSNATTTEPYAPKWLGALLGEEFFAKPASVILNDTADDSLMHCLAIGMPTLESLDAAHTRITDEGCAYLGKMRKLRSLNLCGTKVSDDAVADLARLVQLECLDLSNTGLSDRALRHVSNLTSLERLKLSNTKVTDEGLSHGTDLKMLVHLDLSGTRVTGCGLRCIGELKRLESLYLSRTQIKENDLPHLLGLTQLELLHLDDLRITDVGVRHIAELSSLRHLSIRGTNVTDEGLIHLARLGQLEDIFVSRIAPRILISDEAIEEFRRALPTCTVYLKELEVADENTPDCETLPGEQWCEPATAP